MGLSKEENLKISYAGLVGSVLSITGSLLLILMYILLKKQRKFRSRILVYMSITNIIWVCSIFAGLCYYISNKSNSSFTIPRHSCQATGFLLQWFIVSEDFWVTTIAVYMYFAIVRQKDLVPYEKYILAINWGVPFIIALLPFFGVGGGYDVAGTWCWVKDPVARMYFSYLFAWLTFAIIITSYIFIFLYIRGTTKEVEDLKKQQATKSVRRRNRDIFKKLFAYPIMFLVQWIPATVNRAQNIAAPDDPIVSLYIVHVFVITSAGFVNFVLYGFNNADFFKNIRLLVGSFFSTTTNTDGEIDVTLEDQTSSHK